MTIETQKGNVFIDKPVSTHEVGIWRWPCGHNLSELTSREKKKEFSRIFHIIKDLYLKIRMIPGEKTWERFSLKKVNMYRHDIIFMKEMGSIHILSLLTFVLTCAQGYLCAHASSVWGNTVTGNTLLAFMVLLFSAFLFFFFLNLIKVSGFNNGQKSSCCTAWPREHGLRYSCTPPSPFVLQAICRLVLWMTDRVNGQFRKVT